MNYSIYYMDTQFENEFEVLYQDAQANFQTNRFRDSARGFEYLIQKLHGKGFVEDSIYFAYRTAISYKMADMHLQLISLYKNLGVYFLKHTVQMIEDLNKDVLWENTELLNIYQQTLKYLGEDEMRKTIMHELINIYLSKSNSDDNPELSLSKSLEIALELDDKRRARQIADKLADILMEKREKILLSEKDGYNEIANRIVKKIIKNYEAIGFESEVDYYNELL